MSRFEEASGSARERHVARFGELLPEFRARIEWSAEKLARERDRALRALVSMARERSLWHRERLAGVELEALSGASVECLPVMTKDDLIDNFNDILTDRRVTGELCEAHLAGSSSDSYVLGEYRVVASGGSSGPRSVFVYGWDAWATCYASIVRFQQRDWESDPELAAVKRITAVVAASQPTHISAALGKTFSTAASPRHLFPVSQPLDVIVEGLNDLQPTVLMGYSSFLPRLALEARSGRLRISPRRVIAISEPLLAEVRAAAEEAWRVPVATGYGMSEGIFTGSCGHAIHLPDDLCVFEPVTAAGRPVAPGQQSDRVLVTNLYNPVLPLIRFEVTDEVSLLAGACPCGSVFRRISDPQGRLDDTFIYQDSVSVHPHVFRSALAYYRQVVEYQVHQTPHGADVLVVAEGNVDCLEIGRGLERALAVLGLHTPAVTVRVVAAVDRLATGKLRRFLPLPHSND